MRDNEETTNQLTQESEARAIFNWLDEAVLITLLILSIGGAIVSALTPQDAYLYWLAMIPLFGIGAMLSGGAQARRAGEVRGFTFRQLLKIQLLHWGGVLCTVIGVFVLRYEQLIDEDGTALVMLLILGLATFLDGIRIGWRFSLVGIFLGVSAMIIAYMEQFLPLVVLLAIILIVYSVYHGRRKRIPI